jgi:hypothetical protein
MRFQWPTRGYWHHMATHLEIERKYEIPANFTMPDMTGVPGISAVDPVATRRLRTTLRTFRPMLDRAAAESLSEELRWLAGLLGAARDDDVLTDRLMTAVGSEPPELVVGPVAARIRQRLAASTARIQVTADGQP